MCVSEQSDALSSRNKRAHHSSLALPSPTSASRALCISSHSQKVTNGLIPRITGVERAVQKHSNKSLLTNLSIKPYFSPKMDGAGKH